MTITADAGDALRVIQTLNAQSALAQLETRDLVDVLRDVLSERGVPHTIWTPDALRQPLSDWLGDDLTEDEAEGVIQGAMFTEEWRRLSEPTDEHRELLDRALWNGRKMRKEAAA